MTSEGLANISYPSDDENIRPIASCPLDSIVYNTGL